MELGHRHASPPSAGPPHVPHDLSVSRATRRGFMVALVGLGLFVSAKAYVFSHMDGLPIPVWRVLMGQMPWWLVWAALVPVIFGITRRLRDSSVHRGLYLAVQAGVSVVLSVLHILVVGTLYFFTNQRPPITLGAQLLNWLNFEFLLDVFTYWTLVAAYEAVAYYRLYRERERRTHALEAETARLEREVAEAKLRTLQTELQPHFLFNSFGAVTALVRRGEPETAIDMLTRLGNLLRRTLERGREPTVPLWEELDLLRDYLAIQEMRFDGFLDIRWAIDDDALEAAVPTLILQPLVENALEHGCSGADACRLRIAGRQEAERLVIEIVDSGPGPRSDDRRGLGLTNSQQRVQHLFGPTGSIHLDRAPEGGGRVTLTVPFRPADHPSSAQARPAPGTIRV